MKAIDYQPIKKIDFTSATKKKRKLNEMLEGTDEENNDPPKESVSDARIKDCMPSTDEELSQLFNNMSLAGTKPSVLTLVDPYSDHQIPKSSQTTLPKPLRSLHDPSHIHLRYNELMEACEAVQLEFTLEMSELVENDTGS